MGVNFGRLGTVILNKGAQLVCTADLQITSPGGGGGGDVTPTPTPNWDDPYDVSGPPTTINQTIQGISTSINLFWSCNYCGDGGTVEYSINNGTWTAIAPNVNFSVNNNDTLKFRMVDLDIGSLLADIKNASDGNVILDTIIFQKDVA